MVYCINALQCPMFETCKFIDKILNTGLNPENLVGGVKQAKLDYGGGGPIYTVHKALLSFLGAWGHFPRKTLVLKD